MSNIIVSTVPADGLVLLTHWGRVTHICVSKLSILGSDNGLSPGRRQAIIWTNAGILSIRTLGSNFSEILNEIHAFSFKKMHLKMSSGKRRPSSLGLNVLQSAAGTQLTKLSITVMSKWAQWRLKSPALRLFTQPFIQTQIKENIKAMRHWPLCGEFTGDRWILPHKWPVTWKMFPFDVSSWSLNIQN